MEHVEHFTALIQLITAVNFTFILVSFLERLFELLFNETQIRDRHFSSLFQNIDLCLGSLDSLNPPDQPVWAVFSKKMNGLKSNCNNYKARLNAKAVELHEEAEKIKGAKGVKSFFLFISIYGCFDLLGIGLTGCTSAVISQVLLLIFNIATLCFCIRYIKAIKERKWVDRSVKDCHSEAIVCNFYSLIASMIVYVFFYFIMGSSELPYIFTFISGILSVFLPFCPIVFMFWYFGDGESKVDEKAKEIAKSFGEELDSILSGKTALESTYYTMTQEGDIEWGDAA